MKMKDMVIKIQEIVVNKNVKEPFFTQNFNKDKTVRQMMNVGHKEHLKGWLERLENEYNVLEQNEEFIFEDAKGNSTKIYIPQNEIIF